MTEGSLIQLAVNLGGLGIVTAICWLLLNSFLKEKEQIRKEQQEIFNKFIETSNEFSSIVKNHMQHQSETFEKLNSTLERLTMLISINLERKNING